MKDPNETTTELLAQHADWLRALARQLVADVELADDLAQETLVVALERPPGDVSRPRGWLGSVLRNLFREHVRSGRAREAREAASARRNRLPATDELVERIHTQRRIADVLAALDEPYRTTLLLRFYENLPPRRIAATQGVPVATVKSRLNRGLAKLRAELDRDYGNDRRAWMLALAPWTRELPPFSLLTGGVVLNAKLWLAAGAALVAAGGFVWLRRPAEVAPVPTDVQAAVPGAADRAVRDSNPRAGGDARSSAGRERVSIGRATPAAPAVAALPTYVVRGRALDGDGSPVDGLRVRIRGGEETATTSAGGLFTLETSAESGHIEVADDFWVAVRPGSWSVGGELTPVVIVAPAVQLTGRVADEWGRPVGATRVVVALPDDFEARFGYALDASFSSEWGTSSDGDGHFSLDRVPAVSGAELRAVHARYTPVVMEAPPVTTRGLSIELRSPLVPHEHALRGAVVRLDGTPATEALVSLGLATSRTDESGRFTLDLRHTEQQDVLTAVEAGQQPATLERSGEPAPGSSGWPAFVELHLGPPSLTIEGRVVDRAGAPLAGGRVWVGDPSRFGAVGQIPVRLEALMAGGAVPKEAVDSLASGESGTFGSARPLFEPDALVYWVESDEDGRFELPGLTDRDYTLHVLDRDLHWGAVSPRIAAGSRGVRIEVDTAGVYPTLRGRVLTAGGDAVAGVRVTPWIGAFSAVEPVRGGTADVVRFFLGEAATSDADGRFELQDVPREHVQFHLISDEVVPSYASVESVVDPAAFEIQVLARVHVEVVVAPGSGPDGFRVMDDDGRVVTMMKMRADGYTHCERVALVDGRSGVVTLTTDATVLQLLRGASVVESIPITPRPGRPLTIQR